ncbi:MAG: 16S rRNA (cytidine(1402)-2'-O)-methyltransferase [Anaerolineaceae bacterium]|nr:16S rRNA (cytidine(1402)-2'-O)-methyltransferase [Anaerolineaceae bacterium]
MTYRAIEVLKSVDLIASEDTRKTSILLKHYQISRPQIAFNNFNEKTVTPKLVGRLLAGESIGLVTNAGTPGISDPGYSLTHAAVKAGITVTAVPGATAVIMAVTLSDLPMHSFTFRGFPPHKDGPRRRFLELDKESPHTLVFYESPHRLQAFLKAALDIFGNRKILIANDLTKKFETLYRGNLEEMNERFITEKVLGEYTIVIEGID